jgi:hypothetical protein
MVGSYPLHYVSRTLRGILLRSNPTQSQPLAFGLRPAPDGFAGGCAQLAKGGIPDLGGKGSVSVGAKCSGSAADGASHSGRVDLIGQQPGDGVVFAEHTIGSQK